MSVKNIHKLAYSELYELLERSSVLEGEQAEEFANSLQDVPLYQNEVRLQTVHSNAVLEQMTETKDFHQALILSRIQETVPSFYLSLTLRQLFAQGLIVAVSKNPTTSVIRRAAARTIELPSFGNCPTLQRCAAELLAQAVASVGSADEAQPFLDQLSRLPGLDYSPELQEILENAQREARRAGRDPVVKIDLNQTIARPVKMMYRLFGMGDFRLKVELRGLEYYDQAVVKVPAFSEKGARKVAQDFIRDFLREQSGANKSAKIVDVYPPGSTWESGRHPILRLK